MFSFFKKKIKARIPWWTPSTIEAVEKILNDRMNIFEWGSGGSTVWLAKRARFVWSMEHGRDWNKKVKKWARKEGLGRKISALECSFEKRKYYDYILGIKQEIDFVVIDGRNRVECFKRALQKVRRNGYILVDDTNRPVYKPIYDFREAKVLVETEPDAEGKKATIFIKV